MTIHRRDDCGSATLELVVLAPALILMLLLAIGAGRLAIAHGAIEAAARDAARQASIARDPTTATRQATTSAHAALVREGLRCTPQVRVETSGLGRPVGQPATVTAHITCTVQLSDVMAPGLPGHHTLEAHFTSPIDPYRGRG